jgi:hypothetical protein
METESWGSAFERLAETFSAELVAFLPRLVVALGLLMAGWLLGRIARWVTGRLTVRLARIRSRGAVERAVRDSGVERVASEVVGRIVFWTVLVFFAALAGEVLGLAVASGGLTVVMRYLPSVLAAVLIVLVGLVMSNLARDAVVSLSSSSGVSGRVPGQLVRFTVLLLAAVVALDQIGIDSTLLILAVGIAMAALLGSAALAVGMGARSEVGNIIAVHYLARSYTVGQRVRVGEIEGRLAEFRMNGVVLETGEGRTLVPGSEFSRRSSCLLDGAAR